MADVQMLFLDIGGVLGTNGWDRTQRQLAAKTYDFDYEDFEKRHQECYSAHECGQISLDDYLKRVIFFAPRPFTLEDFKHFILEQSKPDIQMIEFIQFVKKTNNIRVAALSNEGRELAEHRIQKFGLQRFMDAFFISSFMGFQKPNERMYQMALDISQVHPEHVLYVDDRPQMIQIATELRITGILHTSLESTKEEFAFKGLIVV